MHVVADLLRVVIDAEQPGKLGGRSPRIFVSRLKGFEGFQGFLLRVLRV